MLQSTGQATDAITKEELKLFCSNPPFPQLVSCRSLTKEYGLNITNKDEIIPVWTFQLMGLYSIVQAVKRFSKQHGRQPGVLNYQPEKNIEKSFSFRNAGYL